MPARAAASSASTRRAPPALTQAVLEGVAFAFRDCLRVLAGCRYGGDPRLRGRAGGQLAGLALHHGQRARPAARPVGRGRCRGGWGGAARQAAATGADPAALMPPPPVQTTVEPDPALCRAYAEGYERYRALYRLLGPRRRCLTGCVTAPRCSFRDRRPDLGRPRTLRPAGLPCRPGRASPRPIGRSAQPRPASVPGIRWAGM